MDITNHHIKPHAWMNAGWDDKARTHLYTQAAATAHIVVSFPARGKGAEYSKQEKILECLNKENKNWKFWRKLESLTMKSSIEKKSLFIFQCIF